MWEYSYIKCMYSHLNYELQQYVFTCAARSGRNSMYDETPLCVLRKSNININEYWILNIHTGTEVRENTKPHNAKLINKINVWLWNVCQLQC